MYKQQKWNDSRNEYRKIVQSSSDSLRTAHAWHNLGNISFQEKNYAQSIEEYKNALRRNPKDNETRYNLRLAQLLLEKQQQDQQNQDKNNKDQQDKNKDQQKDQKQQNQDQNKNDQNNQDQKDNKQQENPQQQPQQSQMSKENAQQILDAIQQDERDTQEKVQRALMQQQKRKKTDKEW